MSAAKFGPNSSSNEVEYLYTERPKDDICQLCARSLATLTIEEREDHYAIHFAQDEQTATGSMTGLDRPKNWSINLTGGGASMPKPFASGASLGRLAKRKPPPPEDVFWHPLLNHPPPHNYTPGTFRRWVYDRPVRLELIRERNLGLIPVLKRMLLKSYHKSTTVSRAVLCHEGTTHISGQQFDRMWGCGYRNFLMTSTALVAQQQQEMYFTLLDSDPDCAPGVRNLQRWIEEAWSEGYDKIGAEQLRHRLYGTSKWIGTGEIYVAFTYKGIPPLSSGSHRLTCGLPSTTLVDFPKSKDGSKKDTADTLLQWIVGYFDTAPEMAPTPSGSQSNAYDLLRSASPVTVTSLMPLILQHKGHSRTIVGYEVTKNGATNLLIFDPAKAPKSDLRRAALQAHDRMRARRQPTLSVTNQSTPGSSSSLVTLTHRRFRSKILKPLKRVLGGSGNNREPIIIDSDDEGATRQAKRARGSSQESTDDDEIEILVREVMGEPERARRQEPHRDEETEGGLWPEERELDPSKVVNHFRVNIGRLSKHDEYQVLYFPLTEPLTDFQKRQRVVVTSERVVP
ncbi:hypothetical protein FRB97_007512 [Tulasnella sp. 331]|nr:hypothetical protein FRB97_007512 [Tulasnella sp. 331]